MTDQITRQYKRMIEDYSIIFTVIYPAFFSRENREYQINLTYQTKKRKVIFILGSSELEKKVEDQSSSNT